MLASLGGPHLLKVAGPFLVFMWCLGYFISYDAAYTEVVRKFKGQKELFTSDFLRHEIDGDLEGSGIAQLCASKSWTPGLILSCEPPAGGFGWVKNVYLNCMRMAMEMGAELVMPQVVKRSPMNIADVAPGNGGGPRRGAILDYMFDWEHVQSTLSAYCPQMKAYRDMGDLSGVPTVIDAHPFSLDDLGVARVNDTVIRNVTELQGQLKAYLERTWPLSQRKRSTPTRFHFQGMSFAWPVLTDSPAFARNFGRMLRVRQDARRLAASALYNLHRKYRLNLDPERGIRTDSFVGVHLRIEKDAADKFPDFETQAAYLMDYVVSSKARIVFMATGATEQNVTVFAERAAEFDVTVVVKRDILDEEELLILEGLTWDQQALVDYEIMLRAGLFAGPAESPFAWNLALRRSNALGAAGDAAEATHPAGHVQWSDRYSTMFGKSDKAYVYQGTIWP